MTAITLFALALLAALVVGGGRRHALSNGWRRGPEWSPSASSGPARAASAARAGRTAGTPGPCDGGVHPVPRAA
jgi:hypothetical protein